VSDIVKPTKDRRARRLAARAVVLLAALAWPAIALGQTSQQAGDAGVGRVRESIPAAPYLAGAYAFIWLSVLVYVGLVARRLTRVQADIAELHRRLERGAP
jgi:hypothetical protein